MIELDVKQLKIKGWIRQNFPSFAKKLLFHSIFIIENTQLEHLSVANVHKQS